MQDKSARRFTCEKYARDFTTDSCNKRQKPTLNPMKQLLLVSLISLAATPFGFAQTPAPADTKTAEQEVRQMIEQYRNALTKKDTAALERIWADDYTFINASGAVVTKAERLANLKSGATSLDTIVRTQTIKSRF